MHYNKDLLLHQLTQVDWSVKSDGVQGCWNEIENKLIKIVDNIAPHQEFKNNSCLKSKTTPHEIKYLINRRKNLLLKLKRKFNLIIKEEIKSIDVKIKRFYHNRKTNEVKRAIIPGNSSSLWKAVRIAKDVNFNNLPDTMYEAESEITSSKLVDRFAAFFDSKIKKFSLKLILTRTYLMATRSYSQRTSSSWTMNQLVNASNPYQIKTRKDLIESRNE